MRWSTARRLLALWGGWVIGPVAWALHLMIGYLLVEPACRHGSVAALHAVTAATLLVALGGALLSWRQLPPRGAQPSRSSAIERTRFMALGGVLISLLSAAVILVEGVPNFMLSPCL